MKNKMKTYTEIRKDTQRYLQEIGIKEEVGLPLLDEFKIRNGKEIGRRIIQIYALIGLSLPKVNGEKVKKWLEKNKLFESLSSDEKLFFKNRQNGKQSKKERMLLSWKRESLFILMWCVNIADTISFPRKESLVDEYLAMIPPKVEAEKFVNSIKIRSVDEILFQVDLHYALHWIIRNDKMTSTPTECTPNIDVVIERRRALEWIISDERWEDITLDT